MEDCLIVGLYWSRDERAIRESDTKYGRMLHGISYSLTGNREDAEECVSDTYLAAWNNMPTDRPDLLGAYLQKLRAVFQSTVTVTSTAQNGVAATRSS